MKTSMTICTSGQPRFAMLVTAAACVILTLNPGICAAAPQGHSRGAQHVRCMKDHPHHDPDLNELQQRQQFFAKLREMGVDPAAFVAAQAADRPGFELPKHIMQDLIQQAIRNSVRPYSPPPPAAGRVMPFGSVTLDLDLLGSGMVISGGTGSGKTTAIFRMIDNALTQGIRSMFYDFKGESRRFHQFWPQAMVFSPQTAPWQWLQPPAGCDPLSYFIGVMAELRNEVDVHPSTYQLAYSIYERIVRGLAPGDPFPSWADFRRVLEHEAAAQERPNLYTLARAFQNVETVLGPNARVRVAPDVTERFPIVAYDFVGLDTSLIKLFLGLHFNRMLHEAQQHEHTTGLRCFNIIDEAGPIGSIELLHRTGDTLSSVKRFATMSRFTGNPLVLGVQNISQLDPFLKNAPTLVCFRAPSFDDAQDGARMLGLPRESARELTGLGVGDCWIRRAGWPRPVKTHIEAFEP
jgi:Type IV secretion-system coupling protein DNA-binding domain